MKKALLVLFLIIGSITVSIAQNVQEVVYLKNGSVVRGSVIEQVPNVSLKIQTADGSVFAYQMSEVDKITKEESRYVGRNYSPFNNHSGNDIGYRGYIDLGYTLGTGMYGVDRIELTTSHGYQLIPYLYVGAGAGLSYYSDFELFALPIFANVRGYILDNSISPYVDLKIGYSVLDLKGFYMNPSIGCKAYSFNVSVGYEMQKAAVSYIWDGPSDNNIGGVSLNIGFEF